MSERRVLVLVPVQQQQSDERISLGETPNTTGDSYATHEYAAALMTIEASTNGDSNREKYVAFVKVFFQSAGGPHILIVSLLLSCGIGCTVGIVPVSTSSKLSPPHSMHTGTIYNSYCRWCFYKYSL